MIILIGGSSHVGKTLLAQKLMERHAIPYLSLDHLKMMFIRSGLTELTVNDDYKMRYFLWPYVAELVKTAIENKQSMIVEGCYIPSEWREEFTQEYLQEMRAVFITMSEAYLRREIGSVAAYANVIETRLQDEIDPERLIRCSGEFRQECAQQKIPVLDIDDIYDIEEIADRAERLLGLRGENN
ncbi:MAG: adenylate kinase [Lachnospiraceae bacterium]|nr:adenylate kinase [Lachnospiraceae bacterium]